MAVYTRESYVKAPLSVVWEFHRRIDGLAAVTPDWLHLRVERVVGPEGGRGVGVLDEGSEVTLSVRPLGVGPRQRWTSRVVGFERRDDEAALVDYMVDGPFPRWEHTHRFVTEGDGTRLYDKVDWALPGGFVGRFAARVGVLGLDPMFRYRHRRTRTLLEQ